jgi:FHA domain
VTLQNTRSPQPLSDASDEHATEAFEARFGHPVDALPLLEHRLRRRAVPVDRATPGRYLAIDAGGETLLLRLERDITHIGRGFAADLRLDDDRVSRRHAIVVRRGAHTHLLDDRSSNGTFVNGRRIQDARLGDGDLIRVGPVALRYVDVPDAGSRLCA